MCLAHCLDIHPYALCVAFRIFARKLLISLSSEDKSFEHLKSVLNRNGFVDASVLASMWPSELKDSRMLIVNLDFENYVIGGQGFTLIGPSTDGSVSKDIVLLLQGGHFTVLEPKGSASNSDNSKYCKNIWSGHREADGHLHPE